MISPEQRPEELIAGCRTAEDRIDATLATLTDNELRRPSLLPDWSIAHVLAHLAANADSVSRRLRGMIAGQVADQYPGGRAGRAAEIEDRSRQPVAELVADVRSAAAGMFTVIDEVPDDAWGRLSRSVGGNEVPGRAVLLSRWGEVEIHHVDLGLGYAAVDWPADFVAARLPSLLAGLPGRTDPQGLLAWVTGRGPAPELGAWS